MKTKTYKLECVFQSLRGVNFHENLNFIKHFVKSRLLMWSKFELNEKELKTREKILLKLLSHCNYKIKVHTYREIGQCQEELLGEKETVNAKYECPDDKTEFSFQSDVCNSSTAIKSHLLKSKCITSDVGWSDFMFALTLCLSLFQCYVDKNISLGRCIIKIFDPDIAKSVRLTHPELIKEILVAKENRSKLIRAYWAMQWTDNSDMWEMTDTEHQSGKHYIRIPEDMKEIKPEMLLNREKAILHNPS
ncbi:hypothetical protein RUM44_011823 [Polyplax serrata]|uniref:Uncharacterized protein n=1 Tax=Polyplax serrata TaxID=468196 RepID=A0ABR1BDT4_POLSC